MEKIIVSLESTCDLPKNLIDEYDLKIINMDFMIEDKTFSTKIDDVISSKLYENMRNGKKTMTSQVNEYSYENFFEEIIKENKTILHIAFSSGQSDTYFSAKNAADILNKKYGEKIYVIDSLCSCSGQGLLGILARKYAEYATSIDDVIDYIEKIKLKINHNFSVDDLKYLARGGRVKSSTATISSVLRIKPVLKVDNEGKLVVVKNVISRKKALKTIFEQFMVNRSVFENFIIISHADCLSDAEYVFKLIKENTGIIPIITNLGPIIGCHSGPGTIAIFYIGNQR